MGSDGFRPGRPTRGLARGLAAAALLALAFLAGGCAGDDPPEQVSNGFVVATLDASTAYVGGCAAPGLYRFELHSDGSATIFADTGRVSTRWYDLGEGAWSFPNLNFDMGGGDRWEANPLVVDKPVDGGEVHAALNWHRSIGGPRCLGELVLVPEP